MKSTLIIHHDSGNHEHFICPCRDCQADHRDEAYSYGHAGSLGWRFSKDKHWSSDGKQVAVCPSCIKI